MAVAAVPAGPPIFLAYLTRPWLGIVLGASCLLFLFLGVGLRKKPTRRLKILSVSFWSFVLAAQIFFAPAGWAMNPDWFFAALILASLAVIPKIGKRLSSFVPVSSVVLASAFTARDVAASSREAVLLAAGVGIAATLATGWLAHRRVFSGLSGLAIALFALNLMVYPRGLISFSVPFPRDVERVLTQPGVRAVYTYRDPTIRDTLPSEVMFLSRVPGTRSYVLGPHDPYTELFLFSPDDGPRSVAIPLGGRAGNNCFFDPEDPSLVYVLGRDDLLRIATDPPGISATLDLGYSLMPLSHLRYDRDDDAFLAARAITRGVYVIDRKSMKVLRSFTLPPWETLSDVWYDPAGNQIFIAGLCPGGWALSTYDKKTLKRKRNVYWPFDWVYESTIDPKGRKAYLASHIWGVVRVLDLDTLETVGRFRLETGLRGLNFDPERRWVLLSSFYEGRLFVYDPARGEVLGSLFLGKRVRWVETDSENGKWYATSSAGGFEIDPEVAFNRKPLISRHE